MADCTAVVFPGQGSQRVGMASDFVEQYTESAAVFEEAGEVLGFDVFAVCNTEDEKLHLTEFTQPCILTAEIAMLRALRAHFSLECTFYAGHSLGEYSALVAAGAMPFAVALRLVRRRGQLMQSAVAPGVGAMVAISAGEPLDLADLRDRAAGCNVDLANENSLKQVVLSGEAKAVEGLSDELVQRSPELKATRLNVSAPFHSRLMTPVEAPFRAALEEARPHLRAEAAPFVASNFLGTFYSGDTDELINGLTRQVSAPVRWVDNMRALGDSTARIIEVGPNRPLRRFFGTLDMAVQSVIDTRSARRLRLEEDVQS